LETFGKLTPERSTVIELVPDPLKSTAPAGSAQLNVHEGSAGTVNDVALLPQSPPVAPVTLPGCPGTDSDMILLRGEPVAHALETETDTVPPVNELLKATCTACDPCPEMIEALAGTVQWYSVAPLTGFVEYTSTLPGHT
jgi:hypothetical protein